jgi:hypothetical protein
MNSETQTVHSQVVVACIGAISIPVIVGAIVYVPDALSALGAAVPSHMVSFSSSNYLYFDKTSGLMYGWAVKPFLLAALPCLIAAISVVALHILSKAPTAGHNSHRWAKASRLIAIAELSLFLGIPVSLQIARVLYPKW